MDLFNQVINMLMNSPTQALSFLNSIPSEFYTLSIETILGALFVSPTMLAVKKWFSIEAEKKMLSLVMLASLLTSIVVYLLTIPQFAPWIIIVQSGLLFATTQPVYIFFVKPLFRRLGVWFTDQITKATIINEAKAAAVPPEGLPLGSGSDSPQ